MKIMLFLFMNRSNENNEGKDDCENGRIKFDVTNYSSADQAFLGFLLSGKESINTLPFELVVLETAFSSVISRLRRHQVCSLFFLKFLQKHQSNIF